MTQNAEQGEQRSKNDERCHEISYSLPTMTAVFWFVCSPPAVSAVFVLLPSVLPLSLVADSTPAHRGVSQATQGKTGAVGHDIFST